MKKPQNVNDWETTEEWEYIWVSQRRYETMYNEAVDCANNKDVNGFIEKMSSLANIKKPDEENLYAIPQDPKHEIVAQAQMQLANFFLFGAKQTDNGNVIKTKKDLNRAVRYTKLSAENGNSFAQQNLATMYEEGVTPAGEKLPDIKQDYKKALKLYCLAAKQGLEVAKTDGIKLYNKMKAST
tara:strand:+ start:185 stop:733 length:549 start_codon:yes stop_codon:yes gene_type:complete